MEIEDEEKIKALTQKDAASLLNISAAEKLEQNLSG